MKRNRLNLLIGLLLILVFGMWLFVFQVRESETALVTTFGKPTRSITNAGPYLKWPWPIQRVHKFDQRIQNFEDVLDEAQTADNKILLSMVYVGWKITNAEAFFPKFSSGSITEPERGSIATAQSKLKDLLRGAKTAVISGHRFTDIISADPGQFKFEAIENEMLAYIQARIETNNYGIEIKYLGIEKLGLPESTTEKVLEQMSAERAVLVSKILNEGAAAAASIRAQANSDSAKIVNDADAQAKVIKSEGLKQAADQFKVFEQNPELAIFFLRLDALTQSLKDHATLIFSSQTEPFSLLQGLTNAPAKK
jgi:modulator of FtsH protease HflC